MKVNIAYESKYGNGKKCVDYLQNTISKKGHDVEIFSVRETDPNSLPQADVYVFSTPTQVGGPARKMKKFLKKIDIKQEGAKYALMTTHMNPNATTLKKMESFLQTSGMTKASDGLMIKVNGMKGPLEEGYGKKIDTFANDILG